MGYKRPTIYFLAAGVAWAFVACVLGLLTQLQLWIQFPAADSGLGYGVLRPVYTTALIFGAGLSLAMGAAYYAIEKAEGAQLKFEHIGLAAVGTLQAAVLLGIVTILVGENKGHEYGEMTYVSDNLFALSLVLFLVSVLIPFSAKKDAGYSPVLIGVVASAAALLVSFLVANIAQPNSLLQSTPIFAGVQNTAAQEFYRFSLLGFGIIAPGLALSYHFVPEYYQVPLYSKSMSGFQIVGMLLVFPIAGAGALFFMPGAGFIQTMGVAALVAGTAAVLSGALSSVYSVTKADTALRSNRVALFFRYGLFLLIVWSIVRALLALPFLQARFAFTGLNTLDIARDAQTYGLLILMGAAYVAAQAVTGRASVKLLTGWHLGLAMGGACLLLIGDVALGVPQGLALSATSEGKLLSTAWSEIMYAGSMLEYEGKPEYGMLFISGGHGLRLMGMVALALGTALGALNLIGTLFGAQNGYAAPSLKG